MQSIRVSRGIEIEVNDNGETIVVNVEDQNFTERFYRLMKSLDEISTEMDSDMVKGADMQAQAKILIERTKDLMEKIDELFGKECCRKVFGDIIPSPVLLAEFFEQITPITKAYTEARQKEIEKKYSKNRKGARTGK